MEEDNLEWSELMEIIRAGITVNDIEEKILRYVLDTNFTGFVSKKKYSEFINCFETIDNCLFKLKDVFIRDYFYGYLTSKEAEILLLKQEPGSFLVRLSKTNIGSLAVSFVYGNGQVGHVLISTTPEGHVLTDSQQIIRFASIGEVIEHYRDALIKPYSSIIPTLSCFMGDLSSGDAINLLNGEKPGTYILRFSSQFGFFATSFMDFDNQVKHTLIEQVAGGYTLPGDINFFVSISQVIKYYSNALITPLRKINVLFTFGELKEMIINQFLMEISKKENKPEILEAEVGQLVSDEEIRKCQPDQLQEPLEEITDFLPENKASDNQTLNDQEKIVSIPIPEEITTICQPKSIEITNKENESQINLSEQKVVQPITPIPEQLRTSPEQPKKPISEQPKTSTPEQPKISTPEQPKTSTPKQKKRTTKDICRK